MDQDLTERMIFTPANQTMAQALTFTSDFKLGHYMKIPPRYMCKVIAFHAVTNEFWYCL